MDRDTTSLCFGGSLGRVQAIPQDLLAMKAEVNQA